MKEEADADGREEIYFKKRQIYFSINQDINYGNNFPTIVAARAPDVIKIIKMVLTHIENLCKSSKQILR